MKLLALGFIYILLQLPSLFWNTLPHYTVANMDSRLSVPDKELGESARSSVLSSDKELERSATSSVTGPPSLKEKNEDGQTQDAPDENDEEYPKGYALAMIVVALVLSIFLVSQLRASTSTSIQANGI